MAMAANSGSPVRLSEDSNDSKDQVPTPVNTVEVRSEDTTRPSNGQPSDSSTSSESEDEEKKARPRVVIKVVGKKKQAVRGPVLKKSMLTAKPREKLYQAFAQLVHQSHGVRGSERGRQLVSLLTASESYSRSLEAQQQAMRKVASRLSSLHTHTCLRERDLHKRKKQFVVQCQKDLKTFLPVIKADDDE